MAVIFYLPIPVLKVCPVNNFGKCRNCMDWLFELIGMVHLSFISNKPILPPPEKMHWWLDTLSFLECTFWQKRNTNNDSNYNSNFNSSSGWETFEFFLCSFHWDKNNKSFLYNTTQSLFLFRHNKQLIVMQYMANFKTKNMIGTTTQMWYYTDCIRIHH